MDTFIANLESPVGTWGIEGDDEQIFRIYLPNERWRTSRGTAPVAVADAITQLREYFDGTRRQFELLLGHHDATDFQRDVWQALRAIPYGEVRTYAEVAQMVHRPLAARAVGNANHANPWPIVVPCHRVVGASGLGGYGGGDEVKRFLLNVEHAVFN